MAKNIYILFKIKLLPAREERAEHAFAKRLGRY